MPANGSDLLGRMLVVGFNVERISLDDNLLQLILSFSTSSTLNCQCALILVTFVLPSLIFCQGEKEAVICTVWEQGFRLVNCLLFFCFLNRLSTSLPDISPIFTSTFIVTLILEFFSVTPITFQFLPLISHTFSSLLNQLSFIHLVSNLQNLIVIMSSSILYLYGKRL